METDDICYLGGIVVGLLGGIALIAGQWIAGVLLLVLAVGICRGYWWARRPW